MGKKRKSSYKKIPKYPSQGAIEIPFAEHHYEEVILKNCLKSDGKISLVMWHKLLKENPNDPEVQFWNQFMENVHAQFHEIFLWWKANYTHTPICPVCGKDVRISFKKPNLNATCSRECGMIFRDKRLFNLNNTPEKIETNHSESVFNNIEGKLEQNEYLTCYEHIADATSSVYNAYKMFEEMNGDITVKNENFLKLNSIMSQLNSISAKLLKKTAM